MAAVIGLAVSAGLVFYILVGYPLLLALWRGRARPIFKDPAFRPRVTVVMAVHNGAAFLRKKLESILNLDYPKHLMRILVVSDGSTDATERIAAEYAGRGVEALALPRSGKAACLNRAFERADGDVLFLTDVRQLLDSQALSHLVANFADPTVGAATGEMRLLAGSAGEQRDMDLYWRYELWARRRHSEIDSLFTTTGCIYALRRELAVTLPPDTLSDDAYLSLSAFSRGYRVIFDPQAVAFDYPAVAGTEFRRRWRNLAGLWQIHWRMPWLFTSANRMRLHFLSHKFARLVLPWAMLAAFAFTFALPSRQWRNLLLWDEVIFAALALLDAWIPTGIPLKRLSSPARTFLLMNAASLAGLAVLFIPPQKLWKATRADAAEAKASAAG
ncbi:MAG TPA: glycosyltransferase family 2 protein [Bryobacteraceae bacterium]|nr:glycosyltransferase family 2 protein [Bryobacteraceae bacterium]